jgi:hypothetical protein
MRDRALLNGGYRSYEDGDYLGVGGSSYIRAQSVGMRSRLSGLGNVERRAGLRAGMIFKY